MGPDMLAGAAGGLASNVAGNAVYDRMTPNKDEQIYQVLCSIHDILSNMYVFGQPTKYIDLPITLQVNYETPLKLDKAAPNLTHCSVFVWALTNVLVKNKSNDIAVALPANKWTALELPFMDQLDNESSIRLAGAGANVPAVVRFADERWGAVLP